MTAAISVGTHLTFDGECEEAFKFYQNVLGGTVTALSFGASPMADAVPAEWRSKIVHATLTSDAMTLAGADVLSYQRPQGFFVLIEVGDLIRAREIFDALAAGGEVRVAFQETFWSVGYGALVDRFGIPWEINSATR